MVIHWYNYVEILSFILSAVFFADLKKFKLGGFLPYLFVTCVTEVCASSLHAFGLTNNHFMYDIYMVIATPIILYIFLKLLNYSGIKKSIYVITGTLAVLFMLFDLLYLQGWVAYDTYSNTVNTLICILLSLLLLIKVLMDDGMKIKLTDHPYFWICAGLLIFNLCDLIIGGLQQFIALKQIKIGGILLYKILLPVFAAFLYMCFSYSFILCRKLTIRLPLS